MLLLLTVRRVEEGPAVDAVDVLELFCTEIFSRRLGATPRAGARMSARILFSDIRSLLGTDCCSGRPDGSAWIVFATTKHVHVVEMYNPGRLHPSSFTQHVYLSFAFLSALFASECTKYPSLLCSGMPKISLSCLPMLICAASLLAVLVQTAIRLFLGLTFTTMPQISSPSSNCSPMQASTA